MIIHHNSEKTVNKFILKTLLVGLLSLTPALSNAASNVWTDWYPINQVYTYSDGSIFISLDPSSAHSNPAGCASASWLRIMPDQINIKEMYQMALTAQAAGLKLNAYVHGSQCSGSYLKVVHLRSRQ
ncbi:MAG: hypothetical protein ACI9SP_002775 [Arenicella sp.]|jgi:hypothetical protein